jgi:uncharacterized protein
MLWHKFHRWLYQGGHPNALTRLINRGWAAVHSSGIAPNYLVTLEVVGRCSGRMISFPLAMVRLDGESYLVSMLGDKATWVQNLRAAAGSATLRHGRTEHVQLEEVAVEKRARILKAYLRLAPGARPHIPVDKNAPLEEFQAIAAQFPVFRLTSSRTVKGAGMQSKHAASVTSFLVLVFVLLIPFLVLEALHPVEILPGLPLSALGAFTPALAALILTYKQDHLSGVRGLLGRSFDFKRIKSLAWFLLILLIAPAIAVFAYGILRVTGVPLPDPTRWTLAIVPLFILLFIAALGEEIGWTGYATEPLLQRWGTLVASIVLGVIWAAVHFIPLTQVGRSVEWIAWWSLGTISYRVIMTWLYVHSGKSLFGAAVFHAMINLSWQLFPNHGSHYDPRIFSLVAFAFGIAMYVIEQFLLRHHRTLQNFKQGVTNEKIF